jgi:D-sedoheptulose 7-phosphate isomerase
MPEALERPRTGVLAAAIRHHSEVLRRLPDAVGTDFGSALADLREALAGGGKILVCGNGGSAADSQHFAAELTGLPEPVAAIALTVDTSALTAIANDHGYTEVFSRQLRALGAPGDVLVAISTSGRSANVLAACGAARRIGLRVIGLTGADGGPLADRCDVCLRVPARQTARIQEMHGLLLHALWAGILEEARPR